MLSAVTFVAVQWLAGDEADEAILKVDLRTGLFVMHTTRHSYRGSGTVWRDTSSGKRASTSVERFLCDLWTREKWRRDDVRRAAAPSVSPPPTPNR